MPRRCGAFLYRYFTAHRSALNHVEPNPLE
nr:MAG TPA_asm: hypothetical protein [Caudoviricetes sp.]